MLHKLPPEVLLDICRHLRRKDLVLFRLTCKNYAELVAKPLFATIHLMFRRKSFENLIAIARHPVLSKHVTCIYYESMTPGYPRGRWEWEDIVVYPYPLFEDKLYHPGADADDGEMQQYIIDYARWTEQQQVTFHHTETQLSAAYNEYLSICAEAEELDNSLEDFIGICAAFSMMPNLKNLTLVGGFQNFTNEFELTEAMQAAYRPAMVMPDILARDQEDEAEYGVRGFQSCIQGVMYAKSKIQTLVVDKLGWGAFDSEPFFTRRFAEAFGTGESPMQEDVPEASDLDASSGVHDNDVMSLFPSAFQWLKTLRLTFEPDHDNYGSVCIERHNYLGKALQEAKGLGSLYLEFGNIYAARDYRREGIEPVLFDCLVGEITFAKLEHFRLGVSDTNEEFFVDFMQRHPGLKSMILGGLWMQCGEWTSTMQRLKEHLPNLETVKLNGEFGMGTVDTTDEIIVPIQRKIWGPDGGHERPVGGYLVDYFLDNAPFPMRTVAEAKALRGPEFKDTPIDGVELVIPDCNERRLFEYDEGPPAGSMTPDL